MLILINLLIVLTEDKMIYDYVDDLGVKCFLTDKFHKNGTSCKNIRNSR